MKMKFIFMIYLMYWIYLMSFIYVIHPMCWNYLVDLITQQKNCTLTAKDPKQRGLKESLGVYRLGSNVTMQFLFGSDSFRPCYTFLPE